MNKIIYIHVVNRRTIKVYDENMKHIRTFHSFKEYRNWIKNECQDCYRMMKGEKTYEEKIREC